MITIAICDDNENMIYEIKELLMENCQELQTVFDIHTYDKGKKLEQSIYQGMSFDLLYLDIQMEDQDGIETARNIRRLAPDVFIIYISGYDRYIEEVFDVSASNFIRKPIKKERFQKTLRQVCEKIKDRSNYFEYMAANRKKEFHFMKLFTLKAAEEKSRYIYRIIRSIHFMEKSRIFKKKLIKSDFRLSGYINHFWLILNLLKIGQGMR